MKFLAPLLLAATLLPSLAADEDLWLTDLAAAQRLAAESKKDLLLSFTGSDWCPGCLLLEERVFSQEAFRTGTRDAFVLVNLDFPRDQSKLEAGAVERNEQLLERYAVEELPSVILADAMGRPYALTVLSRFEPEGAADYVKHLDELRERRSLRDEALAAAGKLEGLEKARALQDAIADFPDTTVDAFYAPQVEAILAADPEDQSGFRKARDYRKAVAGYETSIEGLFDAGKFEEAVAAADAFIAKLAPTGLDKQHILMAKLMALIEIGRETESFQLLDEIKAIAPESEIGAEADRLRGRMETYFAEDPAPGPAEDPSAPGPDPE